MPTSVRSDPPQCQQKSRGVTLSLGILFAILLICTLACGFLTPQTPARQQKVSVNLIQDVPFWNWAVELGWLVPRNASVLLGSLIALTAVMFGVYAVAIALCWKKCDDLPRERWAVLSSMCLYIIAVGFLPNIDTDVFNYIMRGRVAAVYGENPYEVIVDRFPDDPLYSYAERRYTGMTSVAKLPAWQIINATLAWLGGDNPVTVLLLYRGTFCLLNCCNLLLVWSILRRLKPGMAFVGTLVYGWNPIVIVHGQSKIDTVMACYLLTGIYFLTRGRDRWGSIFLSLSVWTKLITLPMLAAAWLGDLRRRNWSRMAWAAVIFCLVTLAVYLPYGNLPDLIVRHLTQMDEAASKVPNLVRKGLTLLFLALTTIVGLRQNGDLQQLIRGWGVIALFFALFLTKLNLSWYMIVPIAIVALSAEWRLIAISTVCSFCTFLINLRDDSFNRSFPAPDLFGVPRFVVYLALPTLTVLVLLAYNLRRRSTMTAGQHS